MLIKAILGFSTKFFTSSNSYNVIAFLKTLYFDIKERVKELIGAEIYV